MGRKYEYDDYYDDSPEDYEFCPRCSGHGTVSCYCGGDLCFCQNYGEKDCPLCFGEGEAHKDRVAAYNKHEAEIMAAFRAAQEGAGDE